MMFGYPDRLSLERCASFVSASYAGCKFFLADNGVWLTDQVPPEFLTNIDSA
jgi:RNA:NAD 2'-phosphotransferase (TPT1/KptA family)